MMFVLQFQWFMPLYTGGKINSAKQIATIQAKRSNISEKQQPGLNVSK